MNSTAKMMCCPTTPPCTCLSLCDAFKNNTEHLYDAFYLCGSLHFQPTSSAGGPSSFVNASCLALQESKL